MPKQADTTASQVTAYSFKPFIELTPEENERLSPMTRNAKKVIYVHGFLANTKKNKNGWRITDNKYIEPNRGIAAGRPINYGPKVLGKAHHPNFYHDLDLSDKTPEQARKEFLAYQEWSRIGDILRIDYNPTSDRWEFDGAVSHPNIVEAVEKGELELPKYVSPYFWNLNDPDDTGDEIREAELFHVSYVDDPAYGPEAVAGTCNVSEEDGTTCAARVMGLPAAADGKILTDKTVPPCACGLMASIKNKLDSSFYVESPTVEQIQVMSDQSSTQSQPTNNDANKPQQQGKNQDEIAREAALKTMQEYDKKANEGKANIDINNNKEAKEDPNNPTIPVQYQDALNLALEKDRAEQQKGFNKTLKEKDDLIAELQAKITKYEDEGRERVLDQYIDKETFKDEKAYKERRDFYSNLTKELKMNNEQLEELMKGHYQVQEVKYLANKKGKGAGYDKANTDPFGFNNREDNGFGKLSNSSRGLGASVNNQDDEDTAGSDIDDDDNDNTKESSNASAILGAF